MNNAKKRNILWTKTAELDLRNVLDYIALDNDGIIGDILQKIDKQTSSIESSPFCGRVVPELFDFGIQKYREIIVLPWRIIYKIEENKIYILAVIDSRRNVEEILLKRFLTM